MMKNDSEQDVKQLNSFLCGELSAVDTYDQALEKIEDPGTHSVLRENRACHQERCQALTSHIRRLGGEPADSSGIWGGFAKAVQGGAKMLGTSTAISALEEGEDHGLADYRRDMGDLSVASRSFVTEKLLPAQQRTHDSMAALKSLQ